MMKLKVIFIIYFVFLINALIAQSPLDCSTSTVTACSGSPSFLFTQNTSPTNYGAIMDLPGNTTSSISNPSTNPGSTNMGCLLSGELNATWVTVYISSSGTLQFNIAQIGFTDWAMWPYTATTCANIQNNTLAPVACNWNATSTGGTGMGPVPPGGNAGNFEPAMTVTAGQSFILCVTNFSNVGPYTVNMTFSGTAGTACVPFGSVASKTICTGGTTTLTANTNLSSPSYSWMPGGLTTKTISVNPSSTTVYTVSISGTNTISSTYTTNITTGTVTVLPNPTITLSTNNKVCPTGAINLLASSGFTNYTWTGPSAYSQTTTVGNTSIIGANIGMMGSYSVTGRTAQGCTATATSTVGLMPVSTVVTIPSLTVCQGASIYLTSTTSITPTSYYWAGPSAYLSTVQNPTVTNSALPSQSGLYYLSVTYSSGTVSCSYYNTSNVVVTPAIPSSLPVIPTVCSNGTISLIAPGGGSAYSWNGPNSFSSSLQNATINNAGSINIGTYTVTITTGLCVNVGTVNVSVFNPISFSSLPSNTVICFAKNALLSASAIGGSGLLSYSWLPTSGLTNPNSYNTVVNGISSTNYSVSVSDVNCPMTISPIATAFVTVNPTPIISMTTTNSRGCEPFYTDLIGTSVPTSTNCQWRFSNHLGFGSCNAPSYCFPNNGVYGATLTVTDINGCVDSTKNTSFVLVDPKPSVDFGWTPDNPTVLINEVSFYDQSTVGLPITNWHWDFGDLFTTLDNDSSNVANPSHVYDNPFSYSITLAVTNSFGCKDTLMKILKVDDEFALFIPKAFTPNHVDGVNDVFKVSGIGFLVESFQMEIFDRWGELVFKTNDINKGWDGAIKGNKTIKQETYIYKIKLRDFKNKLKEFEGHLTLL